MHNFDEKNWRARATMVALTVLCVAGAGAGRLLAQATASIQGTVTDSTGALMADAAVQVTNRGTGLSLSTKSDPQGRYQARDLGIGDYDIQASKAGFQTTIRKAITLTVGSEVVVDVSLPVGQSQQTVVVEAQVSQVDTTSSAVGNLVESTQMRDLPLNGRNFSQLLTLAPGVQTMQGGGPNGGTGSFYGRGETYSVAGSRAFGQAFLLDDSNVAGFWGNRSGSGATGNALGVEAIGEFQALTNTYSSQFGGSGAVINAVSKSGTNAVHGSAYEFLRNSDLDARNFFDPGNSPPPFRRNQFGGSVGGPVKKDKAFFFVNYEGLRQLLGQSNVVQVPDANAHNGIINGVNIGVSPVVASTLALFPTASSPSTNGIGNYTEVSNQIASENYLLGRLDYVLSGKDTLFIRYIRDTANFVQPSAIPLWPEKDITNNQFVTLEERRIISASLVNLAHISFSRPIERAVTTNSTPPLQFYPGSGLEDGSVSISGVTGIGASSTLPFYLVPNRFTEGDDILWTHGAHSMTFGMTVERVDDNTDAPFRAAGQYTFNSLSAFLQDQPNLLFATLPGQHNSNRDFREMMFTPYFNDNWKVTPKLTLNLGVRYEPTLNPSERTDDIYVLASAPYGSSYQQVPSIFKTNPSLKNFDPRIGLAYDPFSDHKTSIRAGFGMFHDVITANKFGPGYWLSPPFVSVVAPAGLLNAIGHPMVYGPVAPNVQYLPPGQISTTQGYLYNTSNTPYMMQYNFNIQRQLPGGAVLTAGYVGSKGLHLWLSTDINAPVPTIDSSGVYHFASFVNGSIVSNPRVNPTFGALNYYGTNGDSNYNSLQVSLNKRFSHNWQSQISYTWSKSLDDSSIAVGLEGSNNGGAGSEGTENPYCARCDYGPSSFDRRQNLTASTVYSLPFHQNKLVDGWQLSGILTAISGAPFSITTGFDIEGLGDAIYYERTNLAPGCTAGNAVTGNPGQYFRPSCFTLPAIGTGGNLGRDILTGPSLFNADLAVLKNTRLTFISEQFDVQFRAEFFNIFNHPNFATPSTSSEFSQIPGTTNGTVNGNFGQITYTNTTSRQIQFAVKVIF